MMTSFCFGGNELGDEVIRRKRDVCFFIGDALAEKLVVQISHATTVLGFSICFKLNYSGLLRKRVSVTSFSVYE